MGRTLVTILAGTFLSFGQFGVSETWSASTIGEKVGKSDRLEMSVKPKAGCMVLEQREGGLSKLYLLSPDDTGCNNGTLPLSVVSDS